MKRAISCASRFRGWRTATMKIDSPPLLSFCAANHQCRTFSAITPSSVSEGTAVTTGEECYRRALDALERAKVARAEKEAKRSVEQYEAWQKSQEAEKNGRSTKDGVAVVKTIAKQARRQESADQEWEEQAQFWMKQAALEHGHATALVRLGNASLEKANSSNNVEEKSEFTEKAMEYYELAGERGSAEGFFNLGHLLWSDHQTDEQEQDGVIKRDNKESIKSFYKAIELGDPDAMFFVGVQLLSDDDTSNVFEEEYGSLVERYRAGLDLIERSASLEHGGALYYLSLLHLNGHDELQIAACTSNEFRCRLDAAANAGDPDALFLRGHSFYHGDDGYKQDYESALQNFLAAAEAGNSDAAVSAGAMLHGGIGVRKDQRRAFELYQAAGELGNVEGWRNVVACYALGEGVPQSEEMAKYITKTVLKNEK